MEALFIRPIYEDVRWFKAGRATVLKNITLTLEEPGLYCLLGRNGAGKTTLCRFMVDGRFRQEGLEETALEHILRGLKIQGVKQVEARLEPGDGRTEALLLACGFRLAEENTHGALYVPL